jgi:hypothetical protein
MRKIFFVFFGIIGSLSVLAQDTTANKRLYHHRQYKSPDKDGEDGIINYHKQTVFGLKLTSDGYGAFMEIGRQQTIKKSLLFQLEITERKSAKEEKQTDPAFSTSPFIYGKENYFYPIRLGVQQQFLLANKSNKNGVSLSANFGGGVIIGLLRPYEMQVIDSTGNTRYVKYNSSDSSLFLNSYEQNGIDGFIGGPDFTRGWNDLSVVPGLYIKSALRFDYGRANELVSAIEVGLTADYYTQKIPLVVYAPEKQFFLDAFISIMFGKRK